MDRLARETPLAVLRGRLRGRCPMMRASQTQHRLGLHGRDVAAGAEATSIWRPVTPRGNEGSTTRWGASKWLPGRGSQTTSSRTPDAAPPGPRDGLRDAGAG